MRNEKPTWCHLLFYFTYYALNMFRTLIYPSSGACDCVDELPHRSSCSQFVVCWSFCCGNKSSNTQRTENKTTDVVIHQHSRSLLKMDILMSETCWAHNKWNKITSDIKLVFHSSTIAMMHGPINIKFKRNAGSSSDGAHIQSWGTGLQEKRSTVELTASLDMIWEI